MLTIIILIIILVILFIKYLWTRRKYYILSWKLPSHIGLPFIGIAYRCRSPNDMIYYADKLLQNAKTNISVVWVGPIPVFGIRDPEIIRKILPSAICQNKLDLYRITQEYVGNGLILANDSHWSRHRKLLSPLFQLSNLKENLTIFNKESKILAEGLTKYNGNDLIDIRKHIQICVLDITFQSITGESMHFQNDQNVEMVNSLQIISNNLSNRALNPIYYVDFTFHLTKMHKLLKESRNFIEKYISKTIDSRWKLSDQKSFTSTEINQNDKNYDFIENSNKNFLDHTFKLYLEKKFQLDEVFDESVMFFIAAYETTSITSYMAIMCLAMFPEYQEKLYNELKLVFPNKNDFNVDYDDLQKLTYLEMVINETMRLFAPVPIIGRELSEDFQFANDIILPKGGQIFFDIFNMQRDSTIWGPKSKTFYPDHFNPENSINIHPYSFLPFSKGNRMCLGWKYAMHSMKIMLAKLLRKYEFKTDDRFDDLHFAFNLTISFKKFPLFRINERIN